MVDSLSKGLAEGNDLQASLKMVSRGGNFLSVYLGQPDKTFTNFLRILLRLATIQQCAHGTKRRWRQKSRLSHLLIWELILRV
jgi:hypothetical protein